MKSELFFTPNYFRKFLKIAVLCAVMCFAFTAKAQFQRAWVDFSAPSNYQNFDVTEVSVGVDTLGYSYTAASISDTVNNLSKAMLVKYNASGVKQWVKYYDYNSASYNGSYAVSLLVDKAGNSYLCGHGTHNSTSNIDFMVVKFDNAGNQLWVNYWDGGQNIRDCATSAAFDTGGNIIVAGYSNFQGTTQADIAVVKWSSSGSVLWSYQYNNSAVNDDDHALSVACDLSNNVFITGFSFGTAHRDMIVIKLNSSGLNQWTKRQAHVSSDDERGYSITTDVAGNAYVTGVTGDWLTIKYDAAGTVLWTNHYTQNALNTYNAKKVKLDKFNNVIVAGDSFVGGGGHFSDLTVSKLNNTNGNTIWSTTFNNSGSDLFHDMVIDTSANIYVSGSFDGPSSTDMSLLILSPLGTTIWNTSYTNTNNIAGADIPYQMAVDRSKNVFLGGVAERRGNSADAVDVVTLKYSALPTAIDVYTRNTQQLHIYPNPTKDFLNISIDNKNVEETTIVITTILGDEVKREKLFDLNQIIYLNTLAKGLYLVKIENDASIAPVKLIVE